MAPESPHERTDPKDLLSLLFCQQMGESGAYSDGKWRDLIYAGKR